MLLLVLATGVHAEIVSVAQNGNADYVIEVELDSPARMLAGKQRVRWRNTQASATRELWFHLYWNAWRNNQSTWMREDAIRKRSDHKGPIDAGDWGWIEIDKVGLPSEEGGAGLDLTSMLRFVAPDDGNVDDRTVVVLELPQPVAPGAEIELLLEWRAKVPRTFARTGFRGDFYFIAQWFPKLGVYEAGGWNCHQFHASTEFFSDYGRYEVDITVPRSFVVGATGRESDSEDLADGRRRHRYREEAVHDFAWTASPDFVEVLDRFESADLPPVDLRLLMQPEHLEQADRHLFATKAALSTYGTWYGPYPYGHLTIIDPAFGSGAGGMEYPTLFTAGTRLFNPFGGGSPEAVTVHEAGHQFWYGLVGNNEFEDAWLDEGLNTFSTLRALSQTYGDSLYMKRFFAPSGTRFSGFFPILLRGFGYRLSPYGNRVGYYRTWAEIDRQDTPSFRYYPAGGAALSYSKTALWLATLERYLGWQRLQPGMALFFRRWQYAHPRSQDFFAALSEGSGEDLDWFFDQVFHSSERFDYAIANASSDEVRVEGLREDDSGTLAAVSVDASTDTRFRTEVVVRRLAGGVFPVTVLLAFEDGSEKRMLWNGAGRWKLFVEEGPSRLTYAEVDPDGILLLDVDRTNNSMILESGATSVAIRWASRWMLWLQDFFAGVSFFG